MQRERSNVLWQRARGFGSLTGVKHGFSRVILQNGVEYVKYFHRFGGLG